MENTRKNVGSLSADLLNAVRHLKDETANGVNFSDVPLANLRIENTSFIKCEFRRVDISNTGFEGCKFDECLFQAIIVDEKTRFLATKFVPENGVQSIVVRSLQREFFSPKEIVEKLIEIGAVDKDDIVQEPNLTEGQITIVDILSDLERCYRRANPICVESDPGTNRLASNPDWPSVESALIRSGIISSENKGTSGPAKRFLRLRYSLSDIIAAAGKPQEAKELPKLFWSYAAALKLRN